MRTRKFAFELYWPLACAVQWSKIQNFIPYVLVLVSLPTILLQHNWQNLVMLANFGKLVDLPGLPIVAPFIYLACWLKYHSALLFVTFDNSEKTQTGIGCLQYPIKGPSISCLQYFSDLPWNKILASNSFPFRNGL